MYIYTYIYIFNIMRMDITSTTHSSGVPNFELSSSWMESDVYIYLSIYLSIHLDIYIHIYTHICMYMYICIYIIYIHTSTTQSSGDPNLELSRSWRDVQLYIHIYIYIYVCIYMNAYLHIYLFIYLYLYVPQRRRAQVAQTPNSAAI